MKVELAADAGASVKESSVASSATCLEKSESIFMLLSNRYKYMEILKFVYVLHIRYDKLWFCLREIHFLL